jgi:tetratricopeptide (TPR) repeat protein
MADDPKDATGVDADFAAAVDHYQNGRLTEARHLAERVVVHMPNHAAAWHLLGVLHSLTGNQADARVALEKAVHSNPHDPGAAFNLATLLAQLGEHKEAIDNYTRVLAHQPDNRQARLGLAFALACHGRKRQAVGEFRHVLKDDPANLTASQKLASLLETMGLPDQAVDVLDAALLLNPESVPLLTNLAMMLKRIGRLDQAEQAALRLKEKQPQDSEMLALLGGIVRDLGRAREAIAYCGEAIRLKPDSINGHLNLAAALFDVGEFDGAMVCYRKVLELDSSSADAHAGFGAAHQVTGRVAAAIRSWRRTIQLRPDDALAHFNLALALLSAGRYAEGWAEYEWRWKTQRFQRERRGYREPLWDGRDLDGRRLLVWTEQGFGDCFQFARYLPLLAGKGGTVLLEIQPELERVMRDIAGVDRMMPRGRDLPGFDCHVPLMSLPRLFGTTLATVPATVPYLAAEPARVAAWRARLDAYPGFRIGFVWQGSIRHQSNHLRSMSVETLAPLLDLPCVVGVSLQKGEGAAQIADAGLAGRMLDWTDEMDGDGAFVDTAALIETLDLVITVDTAVAHLAGALGRPVWLLLGSAPDFRWLLTRDDSPWYPTMRIFRQTARRQWTAVIEAARAALARRLAGGR